MCTLPTNKFTEQHSWPTLYTDPFLSWSVAEQWPANRMRALFPVWHVRRRNDQTVENP